ncbi:hypothetical protein S2M10_06630 [Sphingomonas sp. S2M10]|nr:hypothetical protein [Sphingomonas sp. S2M10]
MAVCERCRCDLPPTVTWGPWRARHAHSRNPAIFYEGGQLSVTRRAAALLALLIRQSGSAPIEQIEAMAAARPDTSSNVARPLAYRVRKLVADATGGVWRLSRAQYGVYRLEPAQADS